MVGELLQVGHLQEVATWVARRLRELQEPGSRGAAPLGTAARHTP
jgi:hypothetical protein